jgi:hypothetical protein
VISVMRQRGRYRKVTGRGVVVPLELEMYAWVTGLGTYHLVTCRQVNVDNLHHHKQKTIRKIFIMNTRLVD